jgi:hypothetical protein
VGRSHNHSCSPGLLPKQCSLAKVPAAAQRRGALHPAVRVPAPVHTALLHELALCIRMDAPWHAWRAHRCQRIVDARSAASIALALRDNDSFTSCKVRVKESSTAILIRASTTRRSGRDRGHTFSKQWGSAHSVTYGGQETGDDARTHR